MNQVLPKKKKIHRQKPTLKQRAAAKAYIDNFLSGKPITTKAILENVGYSKAITINPQYVTESVGFKQSLAEFGLTEELITSSLVIDIKDKKGKRHQELKLGAEILGMIKREEAPKLENKTTYNFIFSPEVQDRVKHINEDIKRMLINAPHVQENSQDVGTE